jgi:hypothetical protein
MHQSIEPVYQVVHGHPMRNYLVLFTGSYLDCLRRRTVSGDLILNSNGTVCQETGWLFPWEKTDPNCYARRCQRDGWKD